MGKGSRSRAIRAQEKIENPEKYNKKQRKPLPKWIAPTIAIVLLVAIVIGITFSILNNNGVIRRVQTPASSENFEINGAMMSVYFNGAVQSYNNTAAQYAYYYYYLYGSSSNTTYQEYLTQLLGYDTTVALDKQTMKDSKDTWFDYFLAQTEKNVTQMLTYCEAAKANGFELTSEDYAEIDKAIEDMKSSAKEQNVSLSTYLSNNYGTGVKEKDFRAAYELQLLASNYQEKINNTLEAGITAEEVEKYYGDHATDFSVIKYYSYTANTTTDELKDAAKALAGVMTEDEFKEKLTAYIKLEDKDTEDSKKKQDVDIMAAIDDSLKTLAYSTSLTDNYQKWMFSGKWEGATADDPGERVAGKVVVVPGDKKCTVYYLLSLPERNTALIKQNVSYITISDIPEGSDEGITLENVANAMKEKFDATEHTAAALMALDQKNYKNIAEYSSSSKVGVTDIDNWITDAKKGDYKLIKTQVDSTEKDEDGKTIKKDVYYLVIVLDGTESWYDGSFNKVLSDKESDWYKDASTKLTVNFNDKYMEKYSHFN